MAWGLSPSGAAERRNGSLGKKRDSGKTPGNSCMWGWVRAQPDQGEAQGTERVHLQHVAAALNAPFKRERLPFLAEVPHAGRWAPHWWKACWNLGLRGHWACAAAWAPEVAARSISLKAFPVAVCYLLKSGSLARTGPTPDQGTLSSWSGFRAGFGGPCKNTFSGILGGGKERVMVWVLASGRGERNLRKRKIQTKL